MAVLHISEAEAAKDFAGVMTQVKAGVEVIIEDGSRQVAVIRSTEAPRRTITESIALLQEYSEELGYEPLMDADFAADMEEIIGNRKPADRSAWE